MKRCSTVWMTPAENWRSGATTTTMSGHTHRSEIKRPQRRAGRLSNLRAPRPARLPKTTTKTIKTKPPDSRYERGSLGGQVTDSMGSRSKFARFSRNSPTPRSRSSAGLARADRHFVLGLILGVFYAAADPGRILTRIRDQHLKQKNRALPRQPAIRRNRYVSMIQPCAARAAARISMIRGPISPSGPCSSTCSGIPRKPPHQIRSPVGSSV